MQTTLPSIGFLGRAPGQVNDRKAVIPHDAVANATPLRAGMLVELPPDMRVADIAVLFPHAAFRYVHVAPNHVRLERAHRPAPVAKDGA